LEQGRCFPNPRDITRKTETNPQSTGKNPQEYALRILVYIDPDANDSDCNLVFSNAFQVQSVHRDFGDFYDTGNGFLFQQIFQTLQRNQQSDFRNL